MHAARKRCCSHTQPSYARPWTLSTSGWVQACSQSRPSVLTRASLQVAQRISALEDELRRSKRREEKLAALQYRLREDLKQNQGDIR